jgi:hypothetical protein
VAGIYGIAANSTPYATAVEKGFFKEEDADVTGIRGAAHHGRRRWGGHHQFRATSGIGRPTTHPASGVVSSES